MTEHKFNEMVGKNIKKYRLLYNINKGPMTQVDLAKKVGISSSLIGRLESSNINQGISLYNIYKISEVLGVSVDSLLK